MRLFLIVVFFLQLSATSHSQNSDSFLRAIDSSNKALQEASLRLDSISRAEEMRRFNERNTTTLNQFLADRKKQEQKENTKMYIYIGLGIAFLALLLIRAIRKDKQKNRSA